MRSASFARVEAEDAVRAVLDSCPRASARHLRRALREAFWRVAASRSTWYAAIKSVTGGGVLDLKDRGQPELVDRGPRPKRRRTKKGVARAAS